MVKAHCTQLAEELERPMFLLVAERW
jgi:hypothetical protein